MLKLSKYRWSLASLVVTVVTALATLAVIQTLYHRGVWDSRSLVSEHISQVGGSAVLVSFVLGVVSLWKKEPLAAGTIALILSVLSVACYAR
ncbi:MAG TPA: hypothetical protein VGD60_12890 [Candidatus Acidoferrales bacterium]